MQSVSNSNPITLETRLQDEVIAAAKAIAQKHEENAKAYKEEGKIPNQGIHYPFPYMRILKEKNQIERINFLVKRTAVLKGYLKNFKIAFRQGTMGFKLKKNVQPSQALDGAIQGPSLLGCAEVCWLSQWQGLRKVLGDEKFDALFASNSPTPLFIGSQVSQNPLTRIMQKEEFPKLEKIRPGDMVNFSNVPSYSQHHPFGDETTYNVIALRPPKTFTTLGLPAEGASLEEIEEELLHSFNKEAIPMNPDLLPKGLTKMGILAEPASSKPPLTKRRFKKMHGGRLGLIFRLDPEKVQYLVDASASLGRQALDRWKGELV